MAKQLGNNPIQGKLGNLCGYLLNGKPVLRRITSVDKKRMKRDPRFKRTLEFASQFGRASKIGSAVYRLLPKDRKKHSLYKTITGKAMTLLNQGKDHATIVKLLKQQYITAPAQQASSADAWAWND